ncbi:MAG: hypothetical protein GYA17_10040 [Chloroflexi bacterium]|jgi:hypothetical protein|nr:hypothetical protein [Anaerolineaceae bacterium]NMB88691.1 hypothetical protein [Chloroflexota bacterium]
MGPIDQQAQKQTTPRSRTSNAQKAGVVLILSGFILLGDLYFKTSWLSLAVLPALGLFLLAESLALQVSTWVVPGALTFGAGIGSFLAFSTQLNLNLWQRSGSFLLAFGLSWFVITLLSLRLFETPAWWAMIPGSLLSTTGFTLMQEPIHPLAFVLYVGGGLGLALLAWGLASKLFGLIIPGCLLIGIGPGIYGAWAAPSEPNGLVQTGVMLVSFALGWGLITLFSRRVTHNFVWWPLIPGGILSMVGWGLYIGGNPGNAVYFIGNTGSVGLILFGIYLLLLRKGIHH